MDRVGEFARQERHHAVLDLDDDAAGNGGGDLGRAAG